MDKVNLINIGKRIQYCRRERGYTQEHLAEMMNVSVQMISNLERGNKAIRIENLIKISHIFNVSTDYILMGKECVSDVQPLTQQITLLPEREKRIIESLVKFCLNEL